MQDAKLSPDHESMTSDASAKSVLEMINQIPTDTDGLQLASRLKPVLDILAQLSHSEANAILQGSIAERFSLSEVELRSMRADLKDLRKAPPSKIPFLENRSDILRQLNQDKETVLLNPAIDYHADSLYLTVIIGGKSYILTSDKKLLPFEQLKHGAIRLRHPFVSMSKFSPKGIERFLTSDYRVDLPDLFKRLRAYLTRYVVFPNPEASQFLTLWIIGTYLHPVFAYYPYVWLNADRGSGKSLLMKVMTPVVFNGQHIVNPTPSVLFRDVDANSPTLCIDEVEQLRSQDKEAHGALMSLLNAGHERGAEVKRSEKTSSGGFQVKSYRAYAPKVISGINELEPVLQDRTIRQRLMRKLNSEPVERYRPTQDVETLQLELRDDLYQFALTWAPDLAGRYRQPKPDIYGMDHLNNRELDLWEPIFLLANTVDSCIGSNEVTEAMRRLSTSAASEKEKLGLQNTESLQLLSALYDMRTDVAPLPGTDEFSRYDAGQVFRFFTEMPEFEWIEKRNTLTARLRKIEVHSERISRGSKKVPVYVVDWTKAANLYERLGTGAKPPQEISVLPSENSDDLESLQFP